MLDIVQGGFPQLQACLQEIRADILKPETGFILPFSQALQSRFGDDVASLENSRRSRNHVFQLEDPPEVEATASQLASQGSFSDEYINGDNAVEVKDEEFVSRASGPLEKQNFDSEGRAHNWRCYTSPR